MKSKLRQVKKFKDFTLYCYGDSTVYLLSFKDDMRMSLSFMRFQENYESPKFKGKYFDVLEYVEWYCKSRDQKYFSYMEDWGGFNIPDYVVTRMMKNTSCFSLFEMNIVYSTHPITIDLDDRGRENDKFYLIGALSGDETTLDHELCHGLWHTNPSYRRKTKSIIKGLKKKEYDSLKAWLIETGYHKSVIDDEINAYLSTGMEHEVKGLKKSQIDKISKPFIENFNLFKNEL